jgi:uncharacterized protein (DUF952 family)
MSDPIFHITTTDGWQTAVAAGHYTAAGFDEEGFTHASTAAQVPATAARFYADVDDLVLLRIDPDAVTAEIRGEEAHDRELFPHIYRPLEVEAVVAVHPFAAGSDGIYRVPPSTDR